MLPDRRRWISARCVRSLEQMTAPSLPPLRPNVAQRADVVVAPEVVAVALAAAVAAVADEVRRVGHLRFLQPTVWIRRRQMTLPPPLPVLEEEEDVEVAPKMAGR